MDKKKKVIFYSFGVSENLKRSYWPGEPPKQGVSRHIIDVRDFTPDPYHTENDLKGNGVEDERVIAFIRKKAEEKGVLQALNASLNVKLNLFSNSQNSVCEIYFYCVGGWQRSPFFVEYGKKFTAQKFRKNMGSSSDDSRYEEIFDVESRHLSLEEWNQ